MFITVKSEHVVERNKTQILHSMHDISEELRVFKKTEKERLSERAKISMLGAFSSVLIVLLLCTYMLLPICFLTSPLSFKF
jgi:CHASE3 domain sensor protein